MEWNNLPVCRYSFICTKLHKASENQLILLERCAVAFSLYYYQCLFKDLREDFLQRNKKIKNKLFREVNNSTDEYELILNLPGIVQCLVPKTK